MKTPIALHSVAHRVSHHIPAESEMSRQNRATPPPSRSRTFLRIPRPASVAASRGPRGGCRGGLVEGIAALLGSENRSRSRGVSHLQSHQSRYTVQLRSSIPPNIVTSLMFEDFLFFLPFNFLLYSWHHEATLPAEWGYRQTLIW